VGFASGWLSKNFISAAAKNRNETPHALIGLVCRTLQITQELFESFSPDWPRAKCIRNNTRRRSRCCRSEEESEEKRKTRYIESSA